MSFSASFKGALQVLGMSTDVQRPQARTPLITQPLQQIQNMSTLGRALARASALTPIGM